MTQSVIKLEVKYLLFSRRCLFKLLVLPVCRLCTLSVRRISPSLRGVKNGVSGNETEHREGRKREEGGLGIVGFGIVSV